MSWCTIESDPGVFNEMMWSLGATQVAVKEVYTLDDIAESNEKSYGLIFLFKWVQEQDNRPIASEDETEGLIFAHQIATNACATQALLSILLNHPEIELGEQLTEFKSFVSILDAESRGMAIENADHIRNVHNSFARPEPFMSDEAKHDASHDKEDAHHFIAFVPFNGKVYELDGLKPGPIQVAEISASANWLQVAKPVIEQRMSRYAASETHFALLSVGDRRRHRLQTQLSLLTQQQSSTESSTQEIAWLQEQLSEEIIAEEHQRQENCRRRHNYVPLIVAMLRQLAKRGQLLPLVEAARARARTQQAQQQAAQKKG